MSLKPSVGLREAAASGDSSLIPRTCIDNTFDFGEDHYTRILVGTTKGFDSPHPDHVDVAGDVKVYTFPYFNRQKWRMGFCVYETSIAKSGKGIKQVQVGRRPITWAEADLEPWNFSAKGDVDGTDGQANFLIFVWEYVTKTKLVSSNAAESERKEKKREQHIAKTSSSSSDMHKSSRLGINCDDSEDELPSRSTGPVPWHFSSLPTDNGGQNIRQLLGGSRSPPMDRPSHERSRPAPNTHREHSIISISSDSDTSLSYNADGKGNETSKAPDFQTAEEIKAERQASKNTLRDEKAEKKRVRKEKRKKMMATSGPEYEAEVKKLQKAQAKNSALHAQLADLQKAVRLLDGWTEVIENIEQSGFNDPDDEDFVDHAAIARDLQAMQ